MPTTLHRTATFGSGKAGLPTIGYTLLDSNDSVVASRSTSGVKEVGTLTGIYGATITFSDSFDGVILWDTGENTPSYAAEQYNRTEQHTTLLSTVTEISSSLSTLTTKVDFIRDMTGGMWKIDPATHQMIFYKEDNVTEIARFNLKDSGNNPSHLAVFSRVRS